MEPRQCFFCAQNTCYGYKDKHLLIGDTAPMYTNMTYIPAIHLNDQ